MDISLWCTRGLRGSPMPLLLGGSQIIGIRPRPNNTDISHPTYIDSKTKSFLASRHSSKFSVRKFAVGGIMPCIFWARDLSDTEGNQLNLVTFKP